MKFYLRPRAIRRTGDNTPSSSIWGYVRRMTGWHQAAACALAAASAGVNILPIDLQRRLVDHAIREKNLNLFFILAATYLVAVVLHKILKFILGVYQNWMTESAVYYTRAHIFELYGNHLEEAQADNSNSGEAVSIIGSETDKIGEFVGVAISEAATNVARLIGVIGYMFVVDPKIALVGIVLLLPQVILTPLVQRKLNRLVAINVGLLRALGRDVSHLRHEGNHTHRTYWRTIYRNRMIQSMIRNGLKAMLNTLNSLAPLAVLIIGGYQAMHGQTTLGVILAFISGFDKVSEPVRNLITFYRNAQQANVQHAMIARWMVHDMHVTANRNDNRLAEKVLEEDEASVAKS
ncbi:MAG: ABC transporter transmembrane domain-containing protein [Pararhizobium sp.]